MTTGTLSKPATVAFAARGPLSAAALHHLTGTVHNTGHDTDDELLEHAYRSVTRSLDILNDEDIQLTLFLLYASHYGAFPQIPADSRRT